MALSIPSFDELLEEALSDLRVRLPDRDSSRGSDLWMHAAVAAGVARGILARLAFAELQVFPDTSEKEFLTRWLELYKPGGVGRKAATPSAGVNALRVTLTATSATLTAGDRLTHVDGTEYQIRSTQVLNGTINQTFDVTVDAVSKGEATNKDVNEILTFVSPPTGIQSTATIVVKLTGGTNSEDDEPGRARLKDRLQNPPAGGTANDYQEWALAVAGVANAYVWKIRNGLGTVDVAVLKAGSGASRIGDAALNTAVQTAINALRPVTVKDFRVLTVTSQSQDVDLRVKADAGAGYDWDWDDSAGFTVATGTTTTLLKFSATPPQSLAIGDRIMVNGEIVEVASISGVDITPKVTMTADPPDGTAIYAGGPLTKLLQDAVRALFDSLGPARGTTAGLSWEDSIKVSLLYKTAMAQAGVLDALPVTPGASVTPTDGGGTSIPLLVPGKITIRRL